MNIPKRPIAIVLACAVSPASVYLMRGLRSGIWVNLAFFVIGHGIFWGVAAAPGLAVMGVAALHALILSLLPAPRSTVPFS